MVSRKRYSKEFKLRAAKLVVEQGYSYSKAGERLGASQWSIRQWVKKFQESGELPPADQVLPEVEEMKRLRRANAELKLENEILKKAAAYFAKESL